MGYTEFDISRTLAMYGYQVIKKDELEALRQQNAQLLEALKDLVSAVGSEMRHGDGDDEEKAWSSLNKLADKLNKARAAIAAAEGGR